MLRETALYYLKPALRRIEAACIDLLVVGSVRREAEEVKDIEVVCIPQTSDLQISLFDPTVNTGFVTSDVDNALEELIAEGHLMKDPQVPKWGPRWKRLKIKSAASGVGLITLELFIADADNFGNAVAIRTGDKDFSRLLYTHVSSGGLLPDYLTAKDGYIWDGEEKRSNRTEEAFWKRLDLGVAMPDPKHRNIDSARALALRAWNRAREEITR